MTTTNALVYYHELVKAGMPDEQAFNQAMAFENAISHLATKDDIQRIDTKLQDFATKEDLQSLVTREDLTNLGIRTDAKFDLIKKDLENVTSKNEFNLLKESIDINHRWTMALLIAALGGIVGILCK
jgi:hypothetical protein